MKSENQNKLNAMFKEIKELFPNDYLEYHKWQMLNGYPGIDKMVKKLELKLPKKPAPKKDEDELVVIEKPAEPEE